MRAYEEVRKNARACAASRTITLKGFAG